MSRKVESASKLAVVIMAAGNGTRLKSRRPKVLHEIGGKPLLDYVIAAASRVVAPGDIYAVIGHQAERVKAAVAATGVRFVEQKEQRGTGHAIQCARASHRRLRKHSRALRRCAAHPAGDPRAALAVSPGPAGGHDHSDRRSRGPHRLRTHRAQGGGFARGRGHRRAEGARAGAADPCARSTPASTPSGPRRCWLILASSPPTTPTRN